MQTLTQNDFYEIIIVIYGIYLLSNTMKAMGNSQSFANSIKYLFTPNQAIGLMPILLGLLSTPSGAIFTGPWLKILQMKII